MEKDFLDLLMEYTKKDIYPFHMPGHKRNQKLCQMENPYGFDITEIDGFDNLHDAKNVIKQAMENAAKLYDAEETRFLVNGSTCGILAAICACTKMGDMVLVARNCHKSVYHALYLQKLLPVYLYPQEMQGIATEILKEDVEQALRDYPKICAVILVSPTYEGIVSDIAGIAEIVHKFSCTLIVDEAHGAHFGFLEQFPETSVRLGADLVIQSVHKTLPAFTQSALLHIGKEKGKKNHRVDKERLYRYLSIFQSSSPSYILMAGIQKSLQIVKEQKDILFPQLLKYLTDFRKEMECLHYLSVLSFKNSDPSKLVIFIKESSGKNGHWLYHILLEKYHLQLEMESLQYVLAMTGIADTKEGFERLLNALKEIDLSLYNENIKKEKKGNDKKEEKITKNFPRTFSVCTIEQALDAKKCQCLLSNAKGFVSADYIYFYPPGIPLVVPGEVFTEEIILKIKENLLAGLEVKGIFQDMVNIVSNESIKGYTGGRKT